MPFAAFDLHKKEVEAVILSDLGDLTHRERFPTTREALLDFAKRVRADPLGVTSQPDPLATT